MQRVLSIDPGSHIGWAIRNGKKTYYGYEDFAQFAGVDGRVHSKFKRWLEGFIRQTRPELIVMESAFFRGKNSEFLFGFANIIIMLAFEQKIPVQKVHLSTAKKYIAVTGKASKQNVIDAIKELGYEPSTDHEADALAILHFQQSHTSEAIVEVGKTISLKPRTLTRVKRKKGMV